MVVSVSPVGFVLSLYFFILIIIIIIIDKFV